ncbi:MAG: PcfJ domain-containing protein [Eubacteriales bacterium]|nr:PcfJ domain-containing protein [Eubacteriales bacterium]
MLVKKYLYEIPLCNTKFIKKQKAYRDQEYVFAKLNVSEKYGKILVADIYSEDRLLMKRFFTDGNSWITLECKKNPNKLEEKEYWHKRSITSAWYISPDYIESKESAMISKDFFKEHCFNSYNNDTGRLICSFISEKMSDKREQYAQNKHQRMMAHIHSVPRLPANINQYCNDYVFKSHYVVLLSKKGKNKNSQCKCLSCNTTFIGKEGIRHKDSLTCPNCGMRAKVVAERWITTARDKSKLLVMFNINGYVMKEWMVVIRSYNSHGLRENYLFDPYYYEINTEKGRYCYEYSYISYTSDFIKRNYSCSDSVHIYADNISEIYPDGWYLRMNLDRLRYADMISLPNLIYLAGQNNITWQLYKIGLYSLAANSDRLPKGKTFEEVLGVSKNYLPIFKKYNATVSELKAVKKADIFVNDELFGKLTCLMRKGQTYELLSKMDRILKLMSYTKMVNYFHKQSEYYPKKVLDNWFTLYLDYVDMIEQINKGIRKIKRIDMTLPNNKFPKELKKAHDRVSLQLKIKKNAKKDAQLKDLAKELISTYAFNKNGLLLTIPEGIEDFINEGNRLNHCVGSNESYMNNHIARKHTILFVRKEESPDVPYYTLTLNDKNNLSQCLGRGNKSMTKEVESFIKEYTKFLNEPVTGEKTKEVA